MKFLQKFSVLLMLLCAVGAKGFSQKSVSKSMDNTIQVKNNLLSLGVGLGRSYYGYGGISPTFSLSYQRGIVELGPGVLTLGLYASYQTYSYELPGYWTGRWSNFTVGPRAEWHYNFDVDKLDLYAGLTLAMRFESYSSTYSNGYKLKDGLEYGGSHFIGGPHFGASYYLSDKIAIFGEFSYFTAWLNAGVTFKF